MALNFTITLATTADADAFLKSRSYVVGFAPTGTDAALFEAFGKAPDAAKHPHAARYYAHIASFSADARKKWGPSLGSAGVGAPVTAAPPKAPAAAPAAADDDEADLFGDDGDAAAAAVKVEKPVAAADAKKSKPKPIAKTICVYDVKPLEAETPPSALEAAVRSIQMDGLSWGETFKVEEIAYGVKKLVVQCVVEDEKVSLDELEEKLMSFEDIIQSIDQLSMNKIT